MEDCYSQKVTNGNLDGNVNEQKDAKNTYAALLRAKPRRNLSMNSVGQSYYRVLHYDVFPDPYLTVNAEIRAQN